MKKVPFFVTASTALTFAFQANAADLCLDKLSYDTERYTQAMRVAMDNRAEISDRALASRHTVWI